MKQDKPDPNRRKALRWALILAPAALLAGVDAARVMAAETTTTTTTTTTKSQDGSTTTTVQETKSTSEEGGSYDPCDYGCGAASVNGTARRTARRTSRRHAAVR